MSVLGIALHTVHSLGKHGITTFDYNLITRTTFLLQVSVFVCVGRRCLLCNHRNCFVEIIQLSKREVTQLIGLRLGSIFLSRGRVGGLKRKALLAPKVEIGPQYPGK